MFIVGLHAEAASAQPLSIVDKNIPTSLSSSTMIGDFSRVIDKGVVLKRLLLVRLVCDVLDLLNLLLVMSFLLECTYL